MITLVRQDEAQPDSYPQTGITDTQAEAALWSRIESYIAYRWSPRSVTWTLQGAGDWTPPLAPAVVEKVERWNGSDWLEITDTAGPLGYAFDAYGTYRVHATVGEETDPPAAVLEAFNRLSGYLEDEITLVNSATRETVNYGNGLSVSRDRPAAWIAQALQHSGAADLLRGYRRA